MPKRILRVFPRRTSHTPDDGLAFIGYPPFRELIPAHDEVHVSCTFTWDIAFCRDIKSAWEDMTDKPVKLGGVALGSSCMDFTPGLYIKPGFTFTSRGCNNNCPFCIVPRVEGTLRELLVAPGNIIQDNNFLQCSRAHKGKVFDMLRSQRGIAFRGGLEAQLIDQHFIDSISSLQIAELWTACDHPNTLPQAVDAIKRLSKAGFGRNKIYCYVLIGGGGGVWMRMRTGAERFSRQEQCHARNYTVISGSEKRSIARNGEILSACGNARRQR